MPRSSCILIYGTDSSLIETRRWVLEKAEFEVHPVQDLSQAREVLSTGTVDIFILCHTLSAEECSGALSLAHLLRPETKNLILAAVLSECSGTARDAILTAFASPQLLISTVNGLVGQVASTV